MTVARRGWQPSRMGHGMARDTGTDGRVVIRPAWDGGVRIVVYRMGGDGIGFITHSRRVPWLNY